MKEYNITKEKFKMIFDSSQEVEDNYNEENDQLIELCEHPKGVFHLLHLRSIFPFKVSSTFKAFTEDLVEYNLKHNGFKRYFRMIDKENLEKLIEENNVD